MTSTYSGELAEIQIKNRRLDLTYWKSQPPKTCELQTLETSKGADMKYRMVTRFNLTDQELTRSGAPLSKSKHIIEYFPKHVQTGHPDGVDQS